jgi:hypothetical protein
LIEVTMNEPWKLHLLVRDGQDFHYEQSVSD